MRNAGFPAASASKDAGIWARPHALLHCLNGQLEPNSYPARPILSPSKKVSNFFPSPFSPQRRTPSLEKTSEFFQRRLRDLLQAFILPRACSPDHPVKIKTNPAKPFFRVTQAIFPNRTKGGTRLRVSFPTRNSFHLTTRGKKGEQLAKPEHQDDELFTRRSKHN